MVLCCVALFNINVAGCCKAIKVIKLTLGLANIMHDCELESYIRLNE